MRRRGSKACCIYVLISRIVVNGVGRIVAVPLGMEESPGSTGRDAR